VEVNGLPTIAADPMQMRQLFQNLIGNALKFHKQDEAPVVRIDYQMINGDAHQGANGGNGNGKLCQITIKDNGIGFDNQYAERIFGAFQRLHGRSEYEGSGIGLLVCQKIVDRHKGNIQAKGAEGEGATFTINLPLEHHEHMEHSEE
jgi:light-regulated signal transduction histidine kinase (bacteriophytochrome)